MADEPKLRLIVTPPPSQEERVQKLVESHRADMDAFDAAYRQQGFRSMYFDRQGRELSTFEWTQKLQDDVYKRVADTKLQDGKWVSTVWLGMDHNFMGNGPPIIFETMVFSHHTGRSNSLDQRRYATEAQALKGHEEMVEEWKDKFVRIDGGEDDE